MAATPWPSRWVKAWAKTLLIRVAASWRTHRPHRVCRSRRRLPRLRSNGSAFSLSREPNSKRPLVLVVDADEMIRATLKAYLGGEGYDVMAVSNCPDAREVLNMFTPALVIAEVEGDGLPGYDLCAHVKQSPRLKHVPVVLTTSSGYPSDYANAHSLGAVVCMTKPYKQERLGHVVRLLAPPPAEFCTQKNGARRVRQIPAAAAATATWARMAAAKPCNGANASEARQRSESAEAHKIPVVPVAPNAFASVAQALRSSVGARHAVPERATSNHAPFIDDVLTVRL